MSDATPDLRDQIRQALRESFTWHITAEWICCDPPAKGHDLCKQGHAALEMVSALLDDDPASHPQRSPILDAVMHAIEPHILAIGVDATQRADELAGRPEEALDQIADERRGRLRAEAAVRRARQVLAGMHDGVLVRRLLTALTIDQPKETR
jgi:hypothetical protein